MDEEFDLLLSIIEGEESKDDEFASISPLEAMNIRQLAFMETKHWYFRHRIEVLSALIDKYIKGDNLDILDIGVGTTTLSKKIDEKGNCIHIEKNDEILEYANNHGLKAIKGEIPWNISEIEGKKFDYVVALNVIEYSEKDEWIINVMKSFLKPNGKIILSTLTNPSLYGKNDKLYGVKKRYNPQDIKDLIFKTGLKEDFTTFFENPPLMQQLSKTTDNMLNEDDVYFNYIAKDNNINYAHYSKEVKPATKGHIKSGNQIFFVLSTMDEKQRKEILNKIKEDNQKEKFIDKFIGNLADSINGKKEEKVEQTKEEIEAEIREFKEKDKKKDEDASK